MTKRLIDLDDALLDEAQEALGTSTMAATVRTALLESVKLRRRQSLIDGIKAGEFDFSEIVDSTGPRNPDGTLKRGDGQAAA